MTNIENLISELIPKAKVYFDSIEEQFRYREKNNYKFEIFTSIWLANIFLLIFTYLPIIPFAVGDLDYIKTKIINFQIFEIKLENFYIRWILLSAILSVIFFLIIKPIEKYLEKTKEKYSLNYKQLSFAYLYKVIKGLEIFLINGHYENATKSLNYLKLYNNNNNFIQTSISFKSENEKMDLSYLEELSIKNKWITFSESTKEIINGFKYFSEKINSRIKAKREVDSCIKILEILLVYEYLQLDKVTSNKIDSIENNLDNTQQEILLYTSLLLNKIEIIDEVKENKKSSSVYKIKNIFENFIDIFNHESILITFFSWLLLLTIIVVGIIYFGIKTVGITMDSTIFIGGVSVILIGAITLSASIFDKKKDKTSNKR